MSVHDWLWLAGGIVWLGIVVYLFLDIVNFEVKQCGEKRITPSDSLPEGSVLPDPCKAPGA